MNECDRVREIIENTLDGYGAGVSIPIDADDDTLEWLRERRGQVVFDEYVVSDCGRDTFVAVRRRGAHE